MFKNDSAANAFLVYLEPIERVLWLQMFFTGRGANSAPPNPLAGFEGPLQGGGEKEGKEGIEIGKDGRDEKKRH